MSVAACFVDHRIVPDTIPNAPEHVLEVLYGSGVQARLGNILTPTQVQDAPIHLSWPGAHDLNTLYTLLMIDGFQNLHYLVVNIPGADVASGDTLAEYIGSGSPQGKGLCRFVWLVYKQNTSKELRDPDIVHIPNTSVEGRFGFRVTEFVNKHNLEQLVAGNLYLAEWDNYVPKLQAQLGRERKSFNS